MLQHVFRDGTSGARFLRLGRRYSADIGPGLIASLLLHGLLAALILYFMMRTEQVAQTAPALVPVDVIRLGESTQSPPAPLKSLVPQQRAEYKKQEAASPNPPMGVRPLKPAPVDTLDAKLRALARLKQPATNLHVAETPATSDLSSTSDNAAPGSEATYAVKDFVRAQVERRWGLDVQLLGKRSFIIPMRIVITPAGVITKVEILDKARFATDAVYRRIALSARNAVLLSSPITLPEGNYDRTMDLTLNFDPRDTLR